MELNEVQLESLLDMMASMTRSLETIEKCVIDIAKSTKPLFIQHHIPSDSKIGSSIGKVGQTSNPYDLSEVKKIRDNHES